MSQVPNNISELIAALENLDKRNLNDEFDLFWSCHGVFEKLKRLSDFDPSNVKKTIKTLKDLPPEIRELKIEELGTESERLETRALNKQDLKQLLEDYEKAQNEAQKEKIENDFYQITGKKNVAQFIRVQNEIAAKNQAEIKRLSPEVKEIILEDLTINRIDESEVLFEIVKENSTKEELNKNDLGKKLKKIGYKKNEIEKIIQKTEEIKTEIKRQTNVEEVTQISPEIKEKIIEVLAPNEQNIKEDLFEVIEIASRKEILNTEELVKELQAKGFDKENVNKIVQKTEEVWPEIVSQKNETIENQISPEVKEKIIEELALYSRDKNEKLFDIVEEASLKNDQEYKTKDLKKELNTKIKDPDRVEEIIQKVEEVRAEIKVEEKAREIAKTTYEKLIKEKLPINKDIEVKIKNEILIAWKEGDEVKIPKELGEMVEARVIIKEAKSAADIFKNENIKAVVNYRSLELRKEISQQLRNNGIRDESLIKEYASVVNKLINNPSNAKIEENRSDIYNFVKNENTNKSPGQIERSIDEARFMASNVTIAPKKFNKLIQKYNVLREKIGSDKLPAIKEVRVTEKMATLFRNSPGMLRLMNGAQKMIGVWEKIGAFPGNVLSKIGVQKVGLKILEKIGGQAAVELVKNAAAVIAKEGTVQGIKSITLGIMGKGAVVAGGSTGAGASVAAVVAAFQALPVVGQVIAVVVVAVTTVIAIIKPIFDGAKKLITKITGIDMNGVKHFLSDTLGLGNFIGGVGQFLFDVGTFLIGIPALFMTINIVSIVTPVVIFFFLGTFSYSLLSENLLSSLVPPTAVRDEVCILKPKSGTGQSGDINCDMNAPENEVPGLISKANYIDVASRMITEGKDYAGECYNDVVNKSLCAGINPLYTLWVWMHESGASNYGTKDKVQDFGINDNSIAENFDAQIKNFLVLDPASNCDLNDPKLAGPDGYWLAWASRFLTGQCDPDVGQEQTGNTGRKYLEDMKKVTWPWIANVPLPNDIHVPKAGKNCEKAGVPFSLTGPTKEVVGDDGQIYICTTGGGSGGTIGTINIIPGKAGTGGAVTQCPFGGFSHNGIWAMDFGVPNGTPIYSTFAGVAYVGEGNGYGVYVDVHSNVDGNEFFIRYAHMPPGGNMVSDGQTVEAGQQIGDSDNNGFSTGPHLHYEVVGANINWDNAGPYFGMTQEEFNSACR